MPLPWSFDIESIGVPGGVGGPCLLMEPDRIQSKPQALVITGTPLEVPSGARIMNTAPAPAADRHEFEFKCQNHAERQFLDDFFDAREGRAGGFWVPTWQWEFELRGYTERLFDGELWVERWGYVESFYPAGNNYRKLMIVHFGGTFSPVEFRFHTVTAVTASVAAGIDQLHVNNNGTSLGVTPMGAGVLPRDRTYRPLWLRWVRFDMDEITAEDETPTGACTVRVSMLEQPTEVAD